MELHPALPLSAMDVRSGAGRITLILPDKAKFELHATAEHGEAVNLFGPQLQEERRDRSSSLSGKVGDGPVLKLTANRGAVTVRREGAIPEGEAPEAPNPPKAPKVLKM